MSKKIEEIDVNFKKAEIGGKELVFADALLAPFELSGFAWYHEEHKLCRLPEAILPETNDGVRYLAYNTSGGMIRFRTNAATIAIRAELHEPGDMNKMPRNGSAGFDLYIGISNDKKFYNSISPGIGEKKIEIILADGLSNDEMRDWSLYMPLYSGVNSVEIGFNPGCAIVSPTPFTIKNPVAIYGSSITQGGCASRTGNAYTNMLTRWVDAPLINLGFSGSARGETAIAHTIASLEMSAFILDYDHNAPNIDHLQATHEPFFHIIRDKQPNLPIIMLTKCDFYQNDDCRKRRDIVLQTWQNAINKGDTNVYFIDGETLFGTDNRDACTVDGCHPNDLGFYRMAKTVLPVLKQVLGE
ncbi:MAG: SGNH/GDSL hydrolase family protein [bacterium]